MPLVEIDRDNRMGGPGKVFLVKKRCPNTFFRCAAIVEFDSRFHVVDTDAAAAEGPVALVIGNADYEVTRLKSPVNDAREMETELAGLGVQGDPAF